jgi:dienelactone hydrolase
MSSKFSEDQHAKHMRTPGAALSRLSRHNGTGSRRMAVKGITVLFLILVILTPILLFPPHRPLPVTGSYGIGTARYTYLDEKRIEQYAGSGEKRRVNVLFWYPEAASGNENFPLVVFSHGGLGTENSNESLYRELASHGYVVCSIGHPYHAFWTKSEDGRITYVSREYFGEITLEDAKTDKSQSYRYYQKWLATRTADINFVIDTILAEATGGSDGVYALVDGGRIGVMGHSLGGSAALAIPRQRDDIAAVIALEAPFLNDITGVEKDEFLWLDEAYPVPVLNIYSDSSWDHLTAWPQYARNADLLSNPSETALSLHLPGAGHFSMTDLVLASPVLTRLLEGGQPNHDPAAYLKAINQACLEFFNRHLKS